MVEATFDRPAPYYRYRTPYSAVFFAKLSKSLTCNPQSTVLDIACGSGMLAIGIQPYVGSVIAIDASPGMLSVAPKHEKVFYIHHDLNVAPFTAARANHAIMGRALHWLRSDHLGATLDSVVEPDGRLANCWSRFAPDVPWRRDFMALRASYNDEGAPHHLRSLADHQPLHDNGWYELGKIYDFVHARMDLTFMLGHALSYSRGPKIILADIEQFKRELVRIFRPHIVNGRIEADIVSTATIFQRR